LSIGGAAVVNVRAQGETIRAFILDNVQSYPAEIASVTALKFSITRQAVNKHIQRLQEQGAIIREGSTRAPAYKLARIFERTFLYKLEDELEEDVVWTVDIKPGLQPLPENVLNIWHHGFTEMFNNAIDHSGGTQILVAVTKTAIDTEVVVMDDGIGIFKKIQNEFNLLDERHAIFELSKGKLTTDPRNHSGEGIFFTSRMFGKFEILSGGLYFSHNQDHPDDWLIERSKMHAGTSVFMELHNQTTRTAKKVFDEFTDGEDYFFDKTIVPVALARYGADELISRSQAKRLLARIDLFRKVVLDFSEIETIGQAFADQIFRVFANDHPEIELMPVNMGPDVAAMISRARGR
jgi:uncharacterized protein (DUF1330 family)